MKEILKKFKSRKFLICVAGIAMGIFIVFGLDENSINTIAGAVSSLASSVVYIYTEGKIDAAAVGKIKETVDAVKDAIDVVEKIEE